MSLYPNARVELLPESDTQSHITPRLIVLHTNGAPGSVHPATLRDYMVRGDIKDECTFDVGTGGDVWEFMDTNVRADCNYKANGFALSVETQDKGAASLPVTPWTAGQVEALVKLLAWLRDEHGIPMVRATAWNGSGVGAHRDFPEWSKTAHSCPGNARTAQVDDIIALAADLGSAQPPLSNPPAHDNTPIHPAGLIPMYVEETDMASPYRITNPNRATQLVRWPSGALGWCSHAEAPLFTSAFVEPDDATFAALVAACTVPPVPPGQ